MTMPVTILANAKLGYSVSNLALQLKGHFEDQGIEVAVFDHKSASLFGSLTRRHLISFHTDLVWPYYKQARYGHPATVLHLQTINPKVYPEHEYLAYLATLAAPKYSGMPVSHVNISPLTDAGMRKITKDWFRPSVASAILSNTRTIFLGVEDGFKMHADADPDSLVVPYNRWDNGCKDLDLHMHVSRVYAAARMQVAPIKKQVFYYNPDDFDPKALPAEAHELYDFVEQFYERVPFRENIGKHGMFLCTSNRESFGMYYIELLVSGSVGVFADYPWIRCLLPNYPFIVSKEDLASTMIWVRENFVEARAMIVNDVLPYIEYHYGQQRYLDSVAAEVNRLESLL